MNILDQLVNNFSLSLIVMFRLLLPSSLSIKMGKFHKIFHLPSSSYLFTRGSYQLQILIFDKASSTNLVQFDHASISFILPQPIFFSFQILPHTLPFTDTFSHTDIFSSSLFFPPLHLELLKFGSQFLLSNCPLFFKKLIPGFLFHIHLQCFSRTDHTNISLRSFKMPSLNFLFIDFTHNHL